MLELRGPVEVIPPSQLWGTWSPESTRDLPKVTQPFAENPGLEFTPLDSKASAVGSISRSFLKKT